MAEKKIFNQSEEEEKIYLEDVKSRLQHAIAETDNAMEAHAKDVQEAKNYLYENKAGMDHVEKVSVRQSITQTAITGENAMQRKKRLMKLMQSPYFGRLDFTTENTDNIYVGIHNFYDAKQNRNIIHDWRAPVSSLFYDYEVGEAAYEAPEGTINGKIERKRQYRIRNGIMEFMIESAMNIHDEILQQQLSQNASQKMKNIVATIQRDQNAIIRNEDAHTLIIQGVAGSGKTSIALHRIAFLLYRFKGEIKSDDILILSPNKVFADYISNVLPELGEEKIAELGMEELADALLDGKYKFQGFFDQISQLLEKEDEALKERIRFKASTQFISQLDAFYLHLQNQFKPQTFVVNKYPIPDTFIKEKFEKFHRLPMLQRMQAIVKDIENDLMFYYQYEINATERNQIRKTIESMFGSTNLRQLYKDFFNWINKPEYLKMVKGSRYEYADVFPLIYLKMKLEGSKPNHAVKHLVIDEMQDYTPLQYRVIARLFNCKKTILGDHFQSVNPYGKSTAETIASNFAQTVTFQMNRSYRSTYEIATFAQQIKKNPDLEVVERHGAMPELHVLATAEAEVQMVRNAVTQFMQSAHQSLGIICKTQRQAHQLFEQIRDLNSEMYLLDENSAVFSRGIVVSSAHLAKGLEFDAVIVPFVSKANFHTDSDRQMLYVACTRAMHQLSLSCTKKPSVFLEQHQAQQFIRLLK